MACSQSEKYMKYYVFFIIVSGSISVSCYYSSCFYLQNSRSLRNTL